MEVKEKPARLHICLRCRVSRALMWPTRGEMGLEQGWVPRRESNKQIRSCRMAVGNVAEPRG